METIMESETLFHTLSDGRTLAYCIYGDPPGVPVFYAHGGPGSRLEGNLFHESAARQGFRLIATDRPGIGQSTFKPDRRLLDYPADISELADALGIDKFGVIGWSGGGAHAVSCGYLIPGRLLFLIALCGYTSSWVHRTQDRLRLPAGDSASSADSTLLPLPATRRTCQ